MAKLAATTQVNVVPSVDPTNHVVHVTPDELRDILFARNGSSFCSFVAIYDMSAKGKMNIRGNSHHGNCFKIAETQALVTFDYAASMERRGDEASGKGNWSQAVVRDDGSLTPLSVHKADVESFNPLRCKPNARVYLRYEWRGGKSRYVNADGNEIKKAEIEPFLPKKESATVQFQVASLKNIVRLTIDKTTYLVDTE